MRTLGGEGVFGKSPLSHGLSRASSPRGRATRRMEVGNANTTIFNFQLEKLCFRTAFFSGFLNEFLFAFGAGDSDLSFAPGDPDLLAAAGTIKVTMLPIF